MKKLGTVTLNTPRLTLRRFTADDAEEMFASWANDAEVTRFLTWTPHGDVSVTRAILSDWENMYADPTYYNWAIVIHGKTDELIGSIALANVDEREESGTVGYCMAKRFWGNGIMTEALSEVLRFAFLEVGFKLIKGQHAANNIGSSRVMEKCGMQKTGAVLGTTVLPTTGECVDIIVREITKRRYAPHAASE